MKIKTDKKDLGTYYFDDYLNKDKDGKWRVKTDDYGTYEPVWQAFTSSWLAGFMLFVLIIILICQLIK